MQRFIDLKELILTVVQLEYMFQKIKNKKVEKTVKKLIAEENKFGIKNLKLIKNLEKKFTK